MDTKKLRQKILDLAIRGKLVPQNPNDEPASVLLQRIQEEKERLIKEGKIKRDKKEKTSDTFHYENFPFEVPENWTWVKIKDVVNYIQRGKSPQYSPIRKYPVLAQKCNQWSGITLESVLFFAPETFEKYTEERFLQTGDIVINSTGTGTLGRIGLFDISLLNGYECIVADSHITVVRCNKSMLPQYVYYFLCSEYQQKTIDDNAAGSTNQKELYIDTIKEFFIPIPPLSEQHHIVQKIKECFALIDEIEENKLSLSQFIKQTKSKVLDLAIRGKLAPQNPNDESASVFLERVKNEQKTEKITARIFPYNNDIEIPDNWKITTMQNICHLSDGENIDDKALPYLDVKYLRGKSETKILTSGKFVPKNSTVILVDGENSGEIFLIKEDGYQGSTFKILNISNFVDKDFIFRILQKEQSAFRESKVGSAIPHLDKKMFRELPVLLPPLAEQKRIVKRIESIFLFLDLIQNNL